MDFVDFFMFFKNLLRKLIQISCVDWINRDLSTRLQRIPLEGVLVGVIVVQMSH